MRFRHTLRRVPAIIILSQISRVECALNWADVAASVSKAFQFSLDPIPVHGPLTSSLILLGTVTIIVGLTFALFGRVIFHPALFISGFVVGSTLSYLLLTLLESSHPQQFSFGNNRTYIYVGVCIGVGLLAGFLVRMVWRLGVFAVGLIGGFALSLVALSVLTSTQILQSQDIAQQPTLQIAIIAITSIIGGFCALLMEKHFVTICTAISGSYCVMFGVDCFVRTGFGNILLAVLRNQPQHTDMDVTNVYYLLGGFVALSVVGILVQYRLVARTKQKDSADMAA